ncbi:MAG: BolA family transcriptional regulator [Gammaproteobacteria bacterium RBG_16_51_14]|nr:MAG: BolA family transcriptional regulator [Gammaproteobacteria bacterium RBG_16_51_14]
MEIDSIKRLIESGIPGSQVAVSGDGTHFQARVVCDVFAGKTMVQQHQLVYEALGDKVGTEIHALSIETYTTEEWAGRKQPRVP